MMDLKELFEGHRKAANDIADRAQMEGREFTGEEREELAKHIEEGTKALERLRQAQGDERMLDTLKSLGVEFTEKPKAQQAKGGDGATIGERFTRSEAFKNWHATVAPNGRIPDEYKGFTSPAVQIGGLKDLLTGGNRDDSAGVFVQNDITGIYEPLGRRQLRVRDLVSTRTTGSDTVEFVKQLTQIDAAAVVPEATTHEPVGSGDPAVTPAQAGVKPYASFTFQKVTESVRTMAVWTAATKRALADAGQLRGLIDQELREDLDLKFEDQIVTGDGEDENFTGLANTSGVQTQAYSSDVTGLDPLLETTRKARTKVRVGGRAVPTAYVFHPIDWEKIDLARLAKNPNNEGVAGDTPRLHGLPVVESEAVTEDEGWVADWRRAVIWDREQTTISVTDSHADFFIRNLVAILAEMRAAFGVVRPPAFVKIALSG